jgi:hypothetical protein
MASLTAAQLQDLVEKLKLIANIQDDDESLAADALAVFLDSTAGGGETTATVEVIGTTLTLNDDVNGDTAIDLTAAANDTLTELVAVIDGTNNWSARLLGRDSVDSSTLKQKAATSAFGIANEQILEYENQELLELIVQQSVDAVETELNRELYSTSYTELIDYPQEGRILKLRHPKVSLVSFVGTEIDDGLTVKYTGSDTNATVEVTGSSVILRSRAGATTTTSTINFSDQATTTAMATAISVVAGWTGTVRNNGPSGYLIRTGVRDVKDTEQTLEAWNDAIDEYEVDYDAGIIEFPWPPSSLGLGGGGFRPFLGTRRRPRLYVEYTAGYDTLPFDIEAVILGVAKDALETAISDTGLLGETLGDYSYSQSVTAFNQRTIAATMEAHANTLDRYRRLTL